MVDAADIDTHIWPENLDAVNVFIVMDTQWRIAFGGRTGLDYNVLPSIMRMQGIPRAQWQDVFECLRVMEGEALQVMSERND